MVRGALLGLGAAMLFGASAPLAKLLLADMGPIWLSGLFYVGAGLALSAYHVARGFKRRVVVNEARLQQSDLFTLLGVVLLGGVVGPALMLTGLSRVSGLVGSLLLNLEAPFTILLAVALFGEHLERRAAGAAAVIVGGAGVLAWQSGTVQGDLRGIISLAGACLAWALDNNLSQRLSLRDPIAVVRLKTTGAGGCLLVVGALTEGAAPNPQAIVIALIVGALSYGLSLVLDMHALRLLGAAREAAFFATAPFIGATLSVVVLGNYLGVRELMAGAMMVTGAFLLVRSRHSHVHTHDPVAHDHSHVHDEHHQHTHLGPVVEPHAHYHEHHEITHEHPHVSDIHHRHRH